MEEQELQQNTDATVENTDAQATQTDENAGADNAAASSGDVSGSELEKLQAEVAEQKDKYLRLMAEFDNFRRRTSKERLELMQTAGKEVIVSLLDVLDDCDRAEKQLQSAGDLAQVKEGIQLVFHKLRSTLQGKGLKAMESVQSEFDVEKHEAITEVPVPDESLKGKVIDEVQKGYYLNDKIIRFAKVVVGK
ncbi:nucleotide exchange factor GrpE [Filimonas effusa]|uniref:Protein GrpE n=1 Tax=Filimonas effusa TaxID=2508721 RepID=A0A4Q1D3G2_9BACT|nr:nucleotide exchange factor GrpE [Filimonas effusa]RXK82838.1 nucleotide exchange factor GrpE [Filimonas effusa]